MADVLVRVSADLKQFEGATKEMGQALDGVGKAVGNFGGSLGKAISGPLSGFASSLEGIGKIAATPVRAIGGITDALGAFGLAANGIKSLAGAIGGVLTGMVEGNAEMETYQTQLGTLMGSADLAKDRLAELAKFGATTPFELPEVVRAEKVLLGFGLTGEKVFKMTGQTGEQFRTTVGDIAAGTGAQFEEIALNMGKFSAGATGEAISRFQEMGIATREQMAAMGIEFAKSGELLSPIPIAMAAVVKIANEKFGGGMDKLSQTFGGQMSTLSDNFNQAKIAVTQPIFDVLKTSIAGVNEFLSSGGFQAALQQVAGLLAGVVRNGVDFAVRGFESLRVLVGNVQTAAAPFLATLQSLGQYLLTTAETGDPLNDFLTHLPESLQGVAKTIGSLIVFGQEFIETLSGLGEGALKAITGDLAGSFSAFAPTGERIERLFGTIATVVRERLIPAAQDIAARLSDVTGTVDGPSGARAAFDALATAVNTVSGLIEAVTDFIADHKAVQVLLIGVLGAAATAWALATAAAIAHTAWTKATTLATAAQTAAQWLLNAALTANPIGIVVVALAGLAAALVYAYNTSEDFRHFADAAFAGVTGAVGAMWNAVRPVLQAFAAAIGVVVDGIGFLLRAIGALPTSLPTPQMPTSTLPAPNAPPSQWAKPPGGGVQAWVGGVPILDTGGLITAPGLAMVHAAEAVVPLGPRGGLIDYDRLASALSRVPLSVSVDDVHGALIRKGRRNAGLSLA